MLLMLTVMVIWTFDCVSCDGGYSAGSLLGMLHAAFNTKMCMYNEYDAFVFTVHIHYHMYRHL